MHKLDDFLELKFQKTAK